MPAAPRPQLKHVVVRMRVSVDIDRWRETFGTEAGLESVRREVVRIVQESDAARGRAIVSARRDGV